MRLRSTIVGLVVASCLAASCGGPLDPSKNTVTTMTGVVPKGGAYEQGFTVSQLGELFVTLTSLTPPLANSTFGPDIMVTAVVGGQCLFGLQIVQENQRAIVGQQALSYPTITPGQYCVWISDNGFFPGDETVVVTVSHP